MKLIAIRNFWYKDTVRGKMTALKKGEEFSLSVKDDAQQIYDLISGLRAYPIDPEFIPEKGKYSCIAQFNYQSDGEEKQASPGSIVTLLRHDAAKFMACGFCRPVDLNQWTPKKLLEPNLNPDGEVKRMFDLPVEKRNWAMDYKVRGGKE